MLNSDKRRYETDSFSCIVATKRSTVKKIIEDFFNKEALEDTIPSGIVALGVAGHPRDDVAQ